MAEEMMDPSAPMDKGAAARQGGRERSREVHVRRLLVLLVIAAVITLGFDAWFYAQHGHWQTLVAAGATAVALLLIPLAYRSPGRAAGPLILLGLVAVFIANELALSGGTVYFAIAGPLVILLSGWIVRPGRRGHWALALLLLVGILAINWFEPLERLPLSKQAELNLFAPLIIACTLAAVLWVASRTIQLGTIRARLQISFVGLALIPAVIIGASSIVSAFQTGQQQIRGQLNSVAALREVQIENWTNSLQSDLSDTLKAQGIEWRVADLLSATNVDDAVSFNLNKDVLKAHFRITLDQSELFEEFFLVNLDGTVALSTDADQEGKTRRHYRFFQEALNGPYMQPPFYSRSIALGDLSIIVARPISDEGHVVGILAARSTLTPVSTLIGPEPDLGGTGVTYLVSSSRRPLLGEPSFDATRGSAGADLAIERQANGSGLYDNYEGTPVIGAYRWLPELEVALLTEQAQSEAFRPLFATLAVNLGITVAAALIAVLVATLITRSIANPLANLARTASEIAAGDLGLSAQVQRADETGDLARAFNSMTAQLRGLIGGLEERVAARTRDLEQRSSYLEAAADVSSAATSILDSDQLIRQVVELIRERFDLYYVGLFMVDSAGEWALLKAGTGDAGRAMLSRGHRIRVGQGMVGWSVSHGQPRVALEAGEDAVRLATAELPETRSEAAIPLQSRGRVLGALTVQDSHPEAFNQDTIAVLKTMADQIAVALDNARLFAQSQQALEAAQRAYGEATGKAWGALLHTKAGLGFRSTERGIAPLEDEPVDAEGEPSEAAHPLNVPITIRGNAIGSLQTYRRREDGPWTAEEVTLLESVMEQLGAALENARLYQDTQRRAARERLVRQITDQVRAAPDVDAIARTAAEGLAKALGRKQGFVQLAPAGNGSSHGKAGDEKA